MRWALVRVAVAVTAMVALAFLIPLALTVRETAHDKAFADAEQQASAMAPVLAVTTDADALRGALASTEAGARGDVAIHLPSGTVVGTSHANGAALTATVTYARAATTEAVGGYTVLQPVVLSGGPVAVVEVYLPDSELNQGVGTAWLVLSGVALVLVLGSTLLADRLAARLVRAARHLADVARTLGSGDTSVRVTTQGPYELREAGQAFNTMAGRMEQMLAAERELAADLSHRLRTPLTALRLNAAALGDGVEADQTRQAVSRLEQEVDQIIRAARGQARTMGPARCDAGDVLRGRLAFWSVLAEDQGRPWGFAGGERPAQVPVAPTELAGVMDVLLGNVFRHTEERVRFSVTLLTERGSVFIIVADGGAGIADPEAALRRGHGAGGRGSTGLGLDIVRRVAESAGGGVHIGRSRLGGAQVSVWFPAEQAAPPPRRPARSRHPVT
ncbi:MAG TPA: HAMP domain-containing sensor histidine kinase [Pseudonocardiaceae bacterium]|jgi:signal transduction histidine kinase|nr:HAMP domain-containing sensor histidine kinase [Pseudonocardiaceae bacterium]